MLFTTYGKIDNPAVLLIHGMCQDWHSMYYFLGKLEEKYHLIIPAMDGFYEGSGEFTSFADQCRQIEEYVQKNYNNKLCGVYGVSQGTIVLSELLARNNICVEKAFFDGTYVAHQGYLAAMGTNWMFAAAKKKNGKFPKAMNIMMGLMGLSEDDMSMLKYVYWDATYTSIKRNMIENYTYHVNPKIAGTQTSVVLCCGSKEPYAKKSHKILMKYLKNCKEIILDGYGHGQMFFSHSGKLCDMIIKEWSGVRNDFVFP